MGVEQTAKRRVLVVDDDDDDIFFLSALVKAHFPAVTLTSISQSDQVMTYLQDVDKRPNLIFLDLDMPLLSGLEVLIQIRRQPALNAIPTIIWSGHLNPGDADRCYESGAATVIAKEASLSAMHQTVEDIFNYWFNLVRLP